MIRNYSFDLYLTKYPYYLKQSKDSMKSISKNQCFLTEIKWTVQKTPQISKEMLLKNNSGVVIYSDFKIYYKSTVIIPYGFGVNTHVDQCNNIKNTQINSHIFSQLISTKVWTLQNRTRIVISTSFIWKIRYPHVEEWNIYIHTHHEQKLT